MFRRVFTTVFLLKEHSHCYSTNASSTVALRSKKSKSHTKTTSHFVDVLHVQAVGGRGGDGCISFLQLWSNEIAGPDGADGGNGGHVIFQISLKMPVATLDDKSSRNHLFLRPQCVFDEIWSDPR